MGGKLVRCVYQQRRDALHFVHIWDNAALALVQLVKSIVQNLPYNFESFGLGHIELLVQLLNARQTKHRALISNAHSKHLEHY